MNVFVLHCKVVKDGKPLQMERKYVEGSGGVPKLHCKNGEEVGSLKIP